MDDPSGSEQLIQELDRKRDAYIEVLQRTHTTLTTAISATRATCGDLSQHRTVIEDDQLAEKATMAVAQRTDSDHDLDAHSSGVNEEQCYAQGRVARLELDREGLRRNVCLSHPASGYTKKILGLKDMSQDRANTQDLASPRVSYADLILKGLELKNDRSRCEIVDVGVDGRAVAIDHMEHSQGKGGAKAIWKALSENLPSLDSPVGRIIVAHDFSPALSAALHYIAQGVFDVDEIFVFLAKPGLVRTGVQDLSSPLGEWRHRTFDFDILYFTLVNQEHEPWHWEDCSPRNDGLLENIRLSRCSSHVALALSGDAVGSVKHTQSGMEELACLFDTFGPWQILNAQCYPDYRKEGFCMWEEYPRQDSYLCGPEAFMATLLSEYHEAYSRMHNLYDAICWLVVPSAECVIKPDALEQFFLSDASAALSKRCFWADSTLTALRRSIQTLINDYNVTFTDDVWEGKHETIWPLQEFSSHRSAIYGTRMSSLRAKFDRKVQRLEDLSREIEARQKEIVDQEARRSTIAANIAAHASTVTIQQGRNIRLLATVSVFFLPLTYVTSVFGMTNMPTEQNYWMFGAVTAAVCVPFFTLVISLNNERGFAF